MLRFSSPLVCGHFRKDSNSLSRNISFIQQLRPRSVLLDKSKHKIIYEFPYISPLSYLIRTKYWVPFIMTAITPIGLLFNDIRMTILGGFVSSWLHSAFVHQMSKFTENTIGKVYINEENESGDVIISSVTSQGNRIDRYHKPSDLIVCDYSTKWSHSMGFIKIYVNNTDLIYQLNVINCKVYNEKSYDFLFGSKWNVQKNKEKTA